MAGQVLLINKAHVKGYMRADGVYVREHDTKVPAAKLAVEFPQPRHPNMADPAPAAAPKRVVVGAQYGGKTPGTAPAGGGKKWRNSLHGGGTGKGKDLLGDDGWASSRPVHYPNAAVHPQPHDDGKPVTIHEPDQPTGAESWTDPAALAVFTPGSAVPAELNGVAFKEWHDAPLTEVSWNFVEGQKHDLDEPPLPEAKMASGKPKEAAAGVIVEEPDGRVWVIKPTNGFGGYDATFPKGRAEGGMSLQASAIKEAFEESGLKVEITGYHGDIERSQTVARYYTARRVGGTPAAMGWESQAVALVPREQLGEFLNMAVDKKLAAGLVGNNA